jgi:choline dehydrogenase-like flavoprotein
VLANDWESRKPAYDFVIVGSGYGGAIAAARLATANVNPKPTVCVLVRGKEWPAGCDARRWTIPDLAPGLFLSLGDFLETGKGRRAFYWVLTRRE